MTSEEFKRLFVKRCTTAHRAFDPKTGETMLYRRQDLSDMAKAAHEKGEQFFHCKPVDPDKPFGELVECDPEYEYILSRALTEDEFVSLCEISSDGRADALQA